LTYFAAEVTYLFRMFLPVMPVASVFWLLHGLCFAELTMGEQDLLAEIRQKKMQLLLEIQVFIAFENVTYL